MRELTVRSWCELWTAEMKPQKGAEKANARRESTADSRSGLVTGGGETRRPEGIDDGQLVRTGKTRWAR